MLIAILCVLILLVVLVGLLFSALRDLESRIDGVRAEVESLRFRSIPGGNGRRVPTPEELTEARNRIDVRGVAHPGGG